MLNRDVRRTSIEVVLDRIAALLHHLADERVGLADRCLGLIDERALRPAPALGVTLARLRLDLTDLGLLVSLAPFAQFVFGFAPVAALGERAAVLRAEALLKLLRARLASDDDSGGHQRDQQNDDQDPDHRSLLSVSRRCDSRT